eukprot:TRINITY_DN32119_c0_g1_i1.p1 TRINITY_DN32119_c0_g1~~TRINITY_DN32119_c0_g1_i1.p1  ORF type:complete len:878 (+),score=279.67 TRINITY_DN32119_c0_g1_i1:102-2735(+)
MEPRGMKNMEDITAEEVSRLNKAMKDSKFRDYMDEYCKETSDPKHRKEYLQYLDQLEAKGEMPEGCALLRTQPGCCVKTNILFKSGQMQKCFINIVHTDQLEDLEMDKKGDGHGVKLPYSLGPPRPDRDNKDEYCMTTDCAVSSRTFFQAMQNPQILKMIIDTAAENLGKNFLKGFEEVKKDYKVMQRMQCKGGFPQPMSVRRETLKGGGKNLPQPKKVQGDGVTPSELKQMRADAKAKKDQEKDEEEETALKREREYEQARRKKVEEDQAPRIRIPVHRLVHSGTIDLTDHFESKHHGPQTISSVPKLLKLTVELPTVKKSSDITMEVTSYNVVIEVPEKYYLDLPLPYEIEDASGTAKFDKVKQTLHLEMPVVPKAPDPELTRAARASKDEGEEQAADHDGSLDEHKNESDEDLPPLEEEKNDETKKEDKAPAEPEKAAVKEPPPRQAAPELKREKLEVGGADDALRIATAPSEPAVEESVETLDEQDYPDFEAAEAFAGARPGYVFKLDSKGLGYYRDLRQAPPRRKNAPKKDVILRRQEDSTGRAADTNEPMVTELSDADYAAYSGKKIEAAPVRRVLPRGLRRYAEDVSTLRRRLLPAECEDGYQDLPRDLDVDWHQNRQNVTLLLEVAGNEEVADVQLSLLDRRLTLEFCARPSSSSSASRWCRRRLRRVLAGPIDPRQWHAEVTPSSSSSAAGSDSGSSKKSLAVILRKADQGSEAWSAAFDASATAQLDAAPVPATAPASATPLAAAGDEERGGASSSTTPASAGGAPGRGPASDEAASPDEQRARPATTPSGKVEALADVGGGLMEDSAALDAAVPVVHGHVTGQDGETAAAGPICDPTAAAAASAQQSAAVMGQSVLLRNRFMYQLL